MKFVAVPPWKNGNFQKGSSDAAVPEEWLIGSVRFGVSSEAPSKISAELTVASAADEFQDV
jgi:hypothetical protein